MNAWRFIDTGPLDGVTNMATDEALLSCFDPASSRPVLRLYGWEPPALSLGRFQEAGTVNLGLCRERSVPVVRRVTGGGAIFHADEITYSLVCSPNDIPAATVKDSFRVLTSFLLAFYRFLGIDAGYAVDLCREGKLGERTPYCFAGRESYDIVAQGKKIGGNAQRRLREVLFQHGSIPLENRSSEGVELMMKPVETECAALSDFGINLPADVLKETLLQAFRENLGEVSLSSLTDEESAERDRLLEKYRSDGWNLKGEW